MGPGWLLETTPFHWQWLLGIVSKTQCPSTTKMSWGRGQRRKDPDWPWTLRALVRTATCICVFSSKGYLEEILLFPFLTSTLWVAHYTNIIDILQTRQLRLRKRKRLWKKSLCSNWTKNLCLLRHLLQWFFFPRITNRILFICHF